MLNLRIVMSLFMLVSSTLAQSRGLDDLDTQIDRFTRVVPDAQFSSIAGRIAIAIASETLDKEQQNAVEEYGAAFIKLISVLDIDFDNKLSDDYVKKVLPGAGPIANGVEPLNVEGDGSLVPPSDDA